MAKRKEMPRFPVPDNYRPKQDTIQKLTEKYGEMDHQDETDKFINYHQANGSLLAIVDAAYRTWIQNKVRWEANQQSKKLLNQKNRSLPNGKRSSYFHEIADRIRH